MKQGLSEIDLIRSITKESFYRFLQEFWDTIIPETPVWNWHIEYLCNELQRMAERVFLDLPKEHDLVINISPGSTKSTICSRMFPAWIWTRDPTKSCICASYEHDLSLDMSRHCRDIVRSDLYQACFPEIKIRKDQDTKGLFANTKGGERKAIGVGGNITGKHGDIIIIDDPINPQKAASEVEMKSINAWMSETIPSRKKNIAINPTILIMQRLHQDDPTENMLSRKSGEVKHICLPALKTKDISPMKLRRYYKNGLMDESRLSHAVLDEQSQTLGEYGFACQYLQTPIPREGGMFKVDRVLVDNPGQMVRKVRYWDKAGTSGGTGAFTVGALIALDSRKVFWVLDIIRGRWDAFERERIIKSTAISDERETTVLIEQEPGSGGKESAENTIRNLSGWRVFADRPTGSKPVRAEPFAAQVNGGNVRMVKANWNKEYKDELAFFPFSKRNDQVDASAAAFNFLNKRRVAIGAL